MALRNAYRPLLCQLKPRIFHSPGWTPLALNGIPTSVVNVSRLEPTTFTSSLQQQQQRRRWNTQQAQAQEQPKKYNFEDIKALSASPSPSRILIDVREPHELHQTGTIPTAKNLPITSHPDALFLPAEEFEDKFEFPKPAHDTEVIFYCKAGVRSRSAAGLAKMAGWRDVGEYEGSWMDWVGRGGDVEVVK